MINFNDSSEHTSPRLPDDAARVAIAFAHHTFRGGPVRLAMNLYALAQLAEDSTSLKANAFLLRNCARDMASALALMPQLAHGSDKLAPLIETVIADPIERADNLFLQLAAPMLAAAEE